MEAPLLNPITKRYADHSNAKRFAFSFFCDQCGKEWQSTPQVFLAGAMELPMDLRILRMLWNDRHIAAYERANLEAIDAFYYCPECGRRVCVECYAASETEMADVCKICIHTLKTPWRR